MISIDFRSIHKCFCKVFFFFTKIYLCYNAIILTSQDMNKDKDIGDKIQIFHISILYIMVIFQDYIDYIIILINNPILSLPTP